MPSREATLLSDFLVAPASLRNVMTQAQFVKLFPKQAANPAVPAMYRELHALRERDIAAVSQDIADEVRRSKRLKNQYAQQRRQLEDANVAGLDPVSLDMEQELSGTRRSKPHTLQTIHASISEACVSLEAQIADLEDETQRALEAVQEAVGELSDLRHGRFVPSASGEDVVKQVLENLKQLEAVCTP